MKRSQEVLELKSRVIQVKPKLPENYKQLFFERYPEYNNYEGFKKFDRVVYIHSSDKDITEKLEELAKENPA